MKLLFYTLLTVSVVLFLILGALFWGLLGGIYMKLESWKCDFCETVREQPEGWLSAHGNGGFTVQVGLVDAPGYKTLCSSDCAIGTFKQWLSQRKEQEVNLPSPTGVLATTNIDLEE